MKNQNVEEKLPKRGRGGGGFDNSLIYEGLGKKTGGGTGVFEGRLLPQSTL